jgi:predicted dinucleotide-binding enzyme
MKIAILGTGHVGGALARLWSRRGHDVFLIARDAASAMSLGEIFPGCKVIDPHESGVAEIVALCVPWHVAKDALSSTGDLSGKVLIDCTNPLNANAT